jgi:hypothetical protein
MARSIPTQAEQLGGGHASPEMSGLVSGLVSGLDL